MVQLTCKAIAIGGNYAGQHQARTSRRGLNANFCLCSPWPQTSFESLYELLFVLLDIEHECYTGVRSTRGGMQMSTKPLDENNSSRWTLAQSLLAAAVQGLTRAVADAILGGWGKGLF